MVRFPSGLALDKLPNAASLAPKTNVTSIRLTMTPARLTVSGPDSLVVDSRQRWAPIPAGLQLFSANSGIRSVWRYMSCAARPGQQPAVHLVPARCRPAAASAVL